MKLLKNTLIVFVVLFGLFACKDNKTKGANEINNDSYTIENIEMAYVPDSTYTVTTKNDSSIYFEKSSNSSRTTISVRTFEGQNFNDDEKFFLYAENYVQDKMKPFEMKSLHLDALGFKRTPCLKFGGTFRDAIARDKNRAFIAQDGHLCRVPNTKSEIAEIKVMHYSAEQLMPKDVIYEYQSFIERLKFVKN
ncbi:hypothetical protein [Portibacter marinus]|uniref:hypothetical protein n=1 Tax=Portibacter marinus TaxID=2898660 RepID=UPI001F3696D5|nr:hypothetical protein [Portibacter marinus]